MLLEQLPIMRPCVASDVLIVPFLTSPVCCLCPRECLAYCMVHAQPKYSWYNKCNVAWCCIWRHAQPLFLTERPATATDITPLSYFWHHGSATTSDVMTPAMSSDITYLSLLFICVTLIWQRISLLLLIFASLYLSICFLLCYYLVTKFNGHCWPCDWGNATYN